MRWWEIILLPLFLGIAAAVLILLFEFILFKNWEVALWGAVGGFVGLFVCGVGLLGISTLVSKHKRK